MQSSKGSALERVNRYAAQVKSGEILTGSLVKMACQRHERDVARAKADPDWFQFRDDRADNIIHYIEGVLRLPDMLDEQGEPVKFKLLDWQVFVIGSLFGWIDRYGYRRFREGYIEA